MINFMADSVKLYIRIPANRGLAGLTGFRENSIIMIVSVFFYVRVEVSFVARSV